MAIGLLLGGVGGGWALLFAMGALKHLVDELLL